MRWLIWPASGAERIASMRARLVLHSVMTAHQLVAAAILLRIDFSKSEDPTVHMYHHVRWKLLTAWVNLICETAGPTLMGLSLLLLMVYHPLSMYCEWGLLQAAQTRCNPPPHHVLLLERSRHAVFCCMLLPSSLYICSMFWRMYVRDLSAVVPAAAGAMLPRGTQAALHATTPLAALADLLLSPPSRRRVKLPAPRAAAATTAFVILYSAVVAEAMARGEYVYPLLRVMSPLQLALLVVLFLSENLLLLLLEQRLMHKLWPADELPAKLQ